MEIHAPKAPHSLSEFFRELLTITAGILIALSLEGIIEWSHHRHLVREARENITSEVLANDNDLQSSLKSFGNSASQLHRILDVVHALEKDRNYKPQQFSYSWNIAELHTTSWNTAAATGAVSYMPYPEVKRYTEIYDLQREYASLQDEQLKASISVTGLLLQKDLATLTDSELREAERAAGTALANLGALHDLAVPLDARYKQLLAH